jgi:hypothetical protein
VNIYAPSSGAGRYYKQTVQDALQSLSTRSATGAAAAARSGGGGGGGPARASPAAQVPLPMSRSAAVPQRVELREPAPLGARMPAAVGPLPAAAGAGGAGAGAGPRTPVQRVDEALWSARLDASHSTLPPRGMLAEDQEPATLFWELVVEFKGTAGAPLVDVTVDHGATHVTRDGAGDVDLRTVTLPLQDAVWRYRQSALENARAYDHPHPHAHPRPRRHRRTGAVAISADELRRIRTCPSRSSSSVLLGMPSALVGDVGSAPTAAPAPVTLKPTASSVRFALPVASFSARWSSTSCGSGVYRCHTRVTFATRSGGAGAGAAATAHTVTMVSSPILLATAPQACRRTGELFTPSLSLMQLERATVPPAAERGDVMWPTLEAVRDPAAKRTYFVANAHGYLVARRDALPGHGEATTVPGQPCIAWIGAHNSAPGSAVCPDPYQLLAVGRGAAARLPGTDTYPLCGSIPSGYRCRLPFLRLHALIRTAVDDSAAGPPPKIAEQAVDAYNMLLVMHCGEDGCGHVRSVPIVPSTLGELPAWLKTTGLVAAAAAAPPPAVP